MIVLQETATRMVISFEGDPIPQGCPPAEAVLRMLPAALELIDATVRISGCQAPSGWRLSEVDFISHLLVFEAIPSAFEKND